MNMACKAAALVAKKKVKKVMDMMPKLSLADKKEVAAACITTTFRETYDILATLIREDDRELQLTCVKGFEVNGDNRATVHLQWLRTKLGTDDKEMMEAIAAAMAACRDTHKAQ